MGQLLQQLGDVLAPDPQKQLAQMGAQGGASTPPPMPFDMQQAPIDRYLPIIGALGSAAQGSVQGGVGGGLGGLFGGYAQGRMAQQQMQQQAMQPYYQLALQRWQNQQIGQQYMQQAQALRADPEAMQDPYKVQQATNLESIGTTMMAGGDTKAAALTTPRPLTRVAMEAQQATTDFRKTGAGVNVEKEKKLAHERAHGYPAKPTAGSTNPVNLKAMDLARKAGEANAESPATYAKYIDQATAELTRTKTREGAQAMRFERADERADKILDGMIDGKLAPTTTGYPREDQAAVARRAAERGISVKTMATDWAATQAYYKALNSQPQVAYRQALTSAAGMIPIVEDKYAEWQATGRPGSTRVFNRAQLFRSAQMGGPEGAAAQNLLAQVNDLVLQLPTIYSGGHAGTNERLKLAAENLQGAFDEPTFKESLATLKNILSVRRHAILGGKPVGPSATEEGVFGGGGIDLGEGAVLH